MTCCTDNKHKYQFIFTGDVLEEAKRRIENTEAGQQQQQQQLSLVPVWSASPLWDTEVMEAKTHKPRQHLHHRIIILTFFGLSLALYQSRGSSKVYR